MPGEERSQRGQDPGHPVELTTMGDRTDPAAELGCKPAGPAGRGNRAAGFPHPCRSGVESQGGGRHPSTDGMHSVQDAYQRNNPFFLPSSSRAWHRATWTPSPGHPHYPSRLTRGARRRNLARWTTAVQFP